MILSYPCQTQIFRRFSFHKRAQLAKKCPQFRASHRILPFATKNLMIDGRCVVIDRLPKWRRRIDVSVRFMEGETVQFLFKNQKELGDFLRYFFDRKGTTARECEVEGGFTELCSVPPIRSRKLIVASLGSKNGFDDFRAFIRHHKNTRSLWLESSSDQTDPDFYKVFQEFANTRLLLIRIHNPIEVKLFDMQFNTDTIFWEIRFRNELCFFLEHFQMFLRKQFTQRTSYFYQFRAQSFDVKGYLRRVKEELGMEVRYVEHKTVLMKRINDEFQVVVYCDMHKDEHWRTHYKMAALVMPVKEFRKAPSPRMRVYWLNAKWNWSSAHFAINHIYPKVKRKETAHKYIVTLNFFIFHVLFFLLSLFVFLTVCCFLGSFNVWNVLLFLLSNLIFHRLFYRILQKHPDKTEGVNRFAFDMSVV